MSKKQFVQIGGLMALCLAVGFLFASDWARSVFAGPNDPKLGADKPPVVLSNDLRALNDAFVAVSKAVTPIVVNITVTSKGTAVSSKDDPGADEDGSGGGDGSTDDPFEYFRRYMPRQDVPQRGSGSGVIISADGYILTNNHVVAEAGKDGQISVDLTDGRTISARLIGADPLTDLAVIKINATGLPVAAFGNSDSVQVGQLVLAVGNPLGLNSTVTQGIVSALGRGQLNLNRDSKGYGVEDFIQTDAAINPGNSGGGLFDLTGSLIGINSAIATRTGYYQGYGFTIPINLAKAVAEDLIDDGKIDRGYIGVQIEKVDQKMAQALKLPSTTGVLVQSVVPDGAGAAAGLKEGDVILEVDGGKVATANHLQSMVAQKRAGQQVKLKVFRDGNVVEKSVTLKARNDAAPETRRTSAPANSSLTPEDKTARVDKLGMEVRPLDSRTRRDRSVSSGVLVGKVDMYGEAMNQKLIEGDIILSVNRRPVSTPAEFKNAVDGAADSVVLLQVQGRDGKNRLVALSLDN